MKRKDGSNLGAVLVATWVTILAPLPARLVGALAVELTEDLRFGLTALGIAIAILQATSAGTAAPLGRLADRLGAVTAIQLASGVAAFSLIGIAVTATTWTSLVAWLMVGTVGVTLGQPGANRLLVRTVPAANLGTVFGIKQSAAPTAGMIAGLSLPLIALTLGWRWAFGLAGVFALSLTLVSKRVRRPSSEVTDGRPAPSPVSTRPRLLLLTIAFGLATASSSSISAFYVTAAVTAGSPSDVAGYLLAAASIGAILVRVASGTISDRLAYGHLRLCGALLGVGSLGFGLLATGHPVTMAVGVVLGLSGTWGFNGVFWFSLVRTHPENPGRVTGLVAPGGFIGGSAGPVVFGILADSRGYTIAWVLAGVLAVSATVGMVLGDRR